MTQKPRKEDTENPGPRGTEKRKRRKKKNPLVSKKTRSS